MDRIVDDFPAAHSMDTTWFGVDDDGEIAVFETGEEGAVPLRWTGEPDSSATWDMFQDCPQDANGHRRIPVDGGPLAAVCDPGLLDRNWAAQKGRRYISNLVVLYANEDAVLPSLEQGPDIWAAPVRFAGAQILVLYPEVAKPELIEAGIAAGGVIGVGPASDGTKRREVRAAALGLLPTQLDKTGQESELYDTFHNDVWPLKYLGVHFYGADYDTTAYEANQRSLAALKFEAMPETAVKSGMFVRLEGVRFSEAAAIQPIAMMECAQWGDRWAGADGSLHPRQHYAGGALCDKDGVPYGPEALRKMAVRPIGSLPPVIDHRQWDQFEDPPSLQPSAPRPPAAKASLWQRLGFGRRKK